MVITVLVVIVTVAVMGAIIYKHSREASASQVRWVDPHSLKFGPPRGELTEAQKTRIAANYEALKEVDSTSVEEQNDLYSRDLNPDSEIAIFEEIARAYTTFTGNHELTIEQKRETYGLLIMRSAASSEDTLAASKLNTLSRAQAEELVALYRMEAKPISVYEEPKP